MGPLQILVTLSEPELLQCLDYTQEEAGWQKEDVKQDTNEWKLFTEWETPVHCCSQKKGGC